MIRSANHSSYPRIGSSPWDQELRRVARERERGEAGDAAVALVEDEVAAMIVAEQSRAFVDVADPAQRNGRRRVPIKVGVGNGTRIQVLEGLKEGDKIVVPG